MTEIRQGEVTPLPAGITAADVCAAYVELNRLDSLQKLSKRFREGTMCLCSDGAFVWGPELPGRFSVSGVIRALIEQKTAETVAELTRLGVKVPVPD